MELEIRGYGDEVEALVRDAKLIGGLTDAAARQRAETLQVRRAARLRQGLEALYTRYPDQVGALLDQIHGAVRSEQRGAPAHGATDDSQGVDPGVWQGFPLLAGTYGAPDRGLQATARPYGDFMLAQYAAELESVGGLNAASDRPSAGAAADVVQFSTRLAEQRRAGAEHPLVTAVKEADKAHAPPADERETAGGDGSGPTSQRPRGSRPSEEDGPNDATPRRRGPEHPRPPPRRPGKRR
jgi:hypothetical protein